jgi:hypothetical protein
MLSFVFKSEQHLLWLSLKTDESRDQAHFLFQIIFKLQLIGVVRVVIRFQLRGE